MGTDQLRELKRLQKENERLRRAVSDPTLDKLILSKAAKGNFCAPPAAGPALIMGAVSSGCRNRRPAVSWGSTVSRRESCQEAGPTRRAWSRT